MKNQVKYMDAITTQMKKHFSEGNDEEAGELAEIVIYDPKMATFFKAQGYACRADIHDLEGRHAEAMDDYKDCIRLLEPDEDEEQVAEYLVVMRRRLKRAHFEVLYDFDLGQHYGTLPRATVNGHFD